MPSTLLFAQFFYGQPAILVFVLTCKSTVLNSCVSISVLKRFDLTCHDCHLFFWLGWKSWNFRPLPLCHVTRGTHISASHSLFASQSLSLSASQSLSLPVSIYFTLCASFSLTLCVSIYFTLCVSFSFALCISTSLRCASKKSSNSHRKHAVLRKKTKLC